MTTFICHYAVGVVFLRVYSMHFPIRAYSLGMALPLLFSAPISLAADDSATSLDTVIVTANRVARTVNDSLASVTVITADDIISQQASSLQNLLQARAGFQLVNNGGAGKTTSLFLRGSESDHVLVLVDGVKINSATTGTSPLELMPLELIERIEIVRGPRTSLYGSDAIGGVIQIFTKKAKAGEKAKPTLSLKVGSDNTQGITAGVRGGFNKGWYSLQLQKENTDGFNSCTGSSTAFAGCFTEEPDRDAYKNTSASFRVGYQLSNTTLLSAQFLRTDNETEFDGAAPFAPNESESLVQSYGITLSSELTDRADIVFSAGHNDNKNKNFQSGTFFSRFNTKRDTYSLQSNIGITDNQLMTLGVDYQNDKVDTTSYNVDARSNTGYFAEYQANIARQSITLGLRDDDNEQFGHKTTGNIAIGHALNSNLKAIASYGTAFKAPTFNELFFPFFGSPTLKPEGSNSIEIGLRGQQAWGNWSTTLYRTKIDNLIVYDPSTQLANNVEKSEVNGFELIANTRIQHWNLSSNLTLLDTEDQSNGLNNGNKLARRADKSLRLNLDRDFGKFSLGSSIIAESDRFDDPANNRRVSGYATADLRVGYRFNKALTLQAKIGNLFDKTYETISFYPQNDRNYMLTLRYAPK